MYTQTEVSLTKGGTTIFDTATVSVPKSFTRSLRASGIYIKYSRDYFNPVSSYMEITFNGITYTGVSHTTGAAEDAYFELATPIVTVPANTTGVATIKVYVAYAATNPKASGSGNKWIMEIIPESTELS